MPTPTRRRLRVARRGAWYALAGVLVLMALVAGVTSTLLPLLERHPERIAAWLSVRAQRPVVFDHATAQWTRRGPLFRLDGLRIGEGKDAVPIGEAEILISQYAGLLPGRSFTELRLRGLELTLVRSADGRWQVLGLPGAARSGADSLDALGRLGELQVIDGQLTVLAPALGIEATLPRVDLRLRVDGERVRAAARAWMHEGRVPLDAVLDFDRVRGDGRAYVAATDADLSEWAPLLQVDGIRLQRGEGNAALWAQLQGHRITQVTMDADLRSLRLTGPVPNPQAGATSADFSRLVGRARWRAVEGGWRLDVPSLRMQTGADGTTDAVDGLIIAGGSHPAVLGKRIDAGSLFALASLSPRTSPAFRRWLAAARPVATLHDVNAFAGPDGSLQARARFEKLSFASVGDIPGLAGLDGALRGDGNGMVFDFDKASTVRLHWPRGFGVAHDIRLDGRLVGWRTTDGWQLQAPGLRIAGKGYGIDLRGGLGFQGDGTQPMIAIAASVDDAAITAAKGFWVRNRMSPAAVKWLDEALQGGRLRNARLVLSGDLDDWPFRDGSGLFQAEADLDDVVVRFLPDWPAAEGLDGHVSFVGGGFHVSGKAVLADVEIPRIEVAVEHFNESPLKVNAQAVTDASKLLALLRQSPLRVAHGDTLQALRASGESMASFALELPRHRDEGKPRIDGTVELRGAELADTRWDLAFVDVRGKARYDRDGFTANDLKTVRDGQPGVLSLRAGPGHVRDRLQAFEADLQTSLSAEDLLKRAPEMAWLRPYLSGRSRWTVGVAIPVASANAQGNAIVRAARLRLRSDLVGTRLRLPAPMDKAAVTPLATTVETRLPMGEGEIAVTLGERLALRARSQRGRTGVRVVLGSDSVASAPPAHGLVASGRADEFDAIGWATLASGSGGGGAGNPAASGGNPAAGASGGGLPLRDIDIATTRLRLLGGVFPDTRIRARPAATGTGVQFEGTALAGSLLLPRQDGAALAGRLQRLHWRSLKPVVPGPSGGDQPVARNPPGDDVDNSDPSKVPPLNIVVDDLRVGDAALGSASLQTRRTATGMQIERLRTRAAKQRIDLTGDWTGRGASARTRLQAVLGSDDFGALLAGFGFGGRIDGGDGEARFDAQWPGSPAQFSLAALQGGLAVKIKDGRLVEIEPGAGRVLGLLSIAELPRRLTLDFRDFFSKGFSFNRIHGNVSFAGGKARSDDLVIDGPAAEIQISGAADLRAKTFDQTIEVLPKAGNLLTAVGALTAGPVGAAVGAVANAMLRKPLSEINAKTYRVTGPWKDPEVEVSSRAASSRSEQGSTPDAPPAG